MIIVSYGVVIFSGFFAKSLYGHKFHKIKKENSTAKKLLLFQTKVVTLQRITTFLLHENACVSTRQGFLVPFQHKGLIQKGASNCTDEFSPR